MGNSNNLGILEETMDWPEGRYCGALPKGVTPAQEAPLYELSESERQCALFTNESLVLQETVGSGKLPCGVPQDRLLKLLQEKASQVYLQK